MMPALPSLPWMAVTLCLKAERSISAQQRLLERFIFCRVPACAGFSGDRVDIDRFAGKSQAKVRLRRLLFVRGWTSVQAFRADEGVGEREALEGAGLDLDGAAAVGFADLFEVGGGFGVREDVPQMFNKFRRVVFRIDAEQACEGDDPGAVPDEACAP